MIVEGRAARVFRRQVSNVELPSGVAGYERSGVPMGEDHDDA